MESGLRRVGTQDGQDPRSGWWCRKRLCRRYEWVRWKNNVNCVIVRDSRAINIKLSSHLHVRVVGGLEGLVQRCWTVSLTAEGVVALGVDDPLVPADELKVHPHVHPATQRPLGRLCCRCSGGWISIRHPHLLHPVPFVASAVTVAAGSVSGHILGVLHSMNEAVRYMALLGQIVFGEDDHHDPVRGCVVYFSSLQSYILEERRSFISSAAPRLPVSFSWGLLCWRSISLVQPVFQQGCHVKNLPGGLGAAGWSDKAPQEKVLILTWRAVLIAALLSGVIQIHSGALRAGESRQSDPEFCQLDELAGGDGRHVERDCPPVAHLMTA